MVELSLFTGVGGGLLGTKLLGWRCVGAVEIDEYCCRVLGQRQLEGFLDEFPIWNMDIREFNERVAGRYRGMVDVVSAGFPCQPFSVAGKRRGAGDERNMWPATIDCIRRVRPRFCFLENVPGLLAGHGYFGTILADLAESGYDVRWRCLSAGELGAPHKRTRLWVLADTEGEQAIRGLQSRLRKIATPSSEREDVANAAGGGTETSEQRGPGHGVKQSGGNVPDAEGERGHGARGTRNGRSESTDEGWWAVEPSVGRVVDGMAGRVGQLRALGNGQVPAVVAAAWELLTAVDP